MRKFGRRIIFLGSFFLLLYFFHFLYEKITDDFFVSNMSFAFPYHKNLEVQVLNKEEKVTLDQILSQPFFYLGKGAQSYVLESQDKQFVIKFFKFKLLNPPFWTKILPGIRPIKNYLKIKEEKKVRWMDEALAGYKIAYELNREASGLQFVHLNLTNDLHKTLILHDKMGFSHQINLDDFIFVVQKKGVPFQQYAEKLLEKNDEANIKEMLEKIFAYIVDEYQKGIYDRDHLRMLENLGFLESKPFRIDMGRIVMDSEIHLKQVYKKELSFIAWKVDEWIKKTSKSNQKLISEFIAEQYYNYTGEKFEPEKINLQEFLPKKKKKFILF